MSGDEDTKMMMKRLLLILFAAIVFAVPSFAAHSVTLGWTASTDATSTNGLTYNVFRLTGACPASGTSGFTQLASGIAATTYADTSIGPGMFCYYVTAELNGAQSIPSNTAAAVVLPASPTSVTIITFSAKKPRKK